MTFSFSFRSSHHLWWCLCWDQFISFLLWKCRHCFSFICTMNCWYFSKLIHSFGLWPWCYNLSSVISAVWSLIRDVYSEHLRLVLYVVLWFLSLREVDTRVTLSRSGVQPDKICRVISNIKHSMGFVYYLYFLQNAISPVTQSVCSTSAD